MMSYDTFCWRKSYLVAWYVLSTCQVFSFWIYMAISNLRWKLLLDLMKVLWHLLFFLLSLVLMTYVLSQSLPWDTNYEWIASFKISDPCPVIISCVALWKVLKLKNNITLITFKSCPCQVLFPEYYN